MQSAPLHPHEAQRLNALFQYEVLDTEDEKVFDELTELASAICGTEISLISLVDKDRQWFKSRVGLDAPETPRNIAFCSHAILQEKVFEVPNALEDERFFDNPLVTGAPDIRFYAGMPLVTPDGFPLGTLCVIDQEPKKLTADQERALQILAKQVITQLELRIHTRQVERINEQREKMFAVVAHDLRSPFNGIMGMSKILRSKAETLKPERIMQAAEGILSSSHKVYQLLDELLQWTKNEMGVIKIDAKGVKVSDVMLATKDFLDDAAALKSVSLNIDADESILIAADETLIKTVMRNLVSNAIKYTPEQGEVTLSAVLQDDVVKMTVRDTGAGIPEDVRASLFSSAVESHVGSAGEQGQGIGLKLCGDFIRKLHGKIWVDDCEQGTQISFTLPKAQG